MLLKTVLNAFTFFMVILSTTLADDQDLILTFVGDIMAHDVNYKMKDYHVIYDRVKTYFEHDDLTFGNLEFPIVEDAPFSTYPSFNVQRSYVRAALDASFEVFSIANNHTLDKGDLGVLKSLASLIMLKETAPDTMYYSGIRGDTEKPFLPVTIHKNGYKIGFLAVTQFLNTPQLAPYVNVVDYRNKEQAAGFIEWIRKVTPRYDLFILSYHGDVEFRLSPDPQKRAFFRALVKAGVTIVWGHHPHVLQPYEIVEVDGLNRLIMYSMGNFVSGMGYYVSPGTPETARAFSGDSALIRVTVGRNGDKTSILAAEPVLISNYTTPAKDIIVDRLETLAALPLYGAWGDYFKKRLTIMKNFLASMETYLEKKPR